MLESRFEGGDALERVLFDRRPLEALHSPIGRRSRGAGYDHQSSPAFPAGLTVIRIGLSALLTEYHFKRLPVQTITGSSCCPKSRVRFRIVIASFAVSCIWHSCL